MTQTDHTETETGREQPTLGHWRKQWRRLLVLPPLALGIGIIVWQLHLREPPVQEPAREVARSVRVIAVEPTPFVPRAVGFGQVQPKTVWTAVAQVAGKIVERAPNLEPGRLIPAGTVILRIDPSDYELAVARNEATIDSVDAELNELRVQEENLQHSLTIERRAVALAAEDLERKRTLLRQGTVSQASVDEAERRVLSDRRQVRELENQLALIPARRRVLEASLALNRTQLEDARLSLQRTTIRMPFDGRINEVAVERDQFVGVGTTLAVADSIDVAEVNAQVPIEQMSPVVRRDIDLSDMTAAELARVPEWLGLSAIVQLRTGTLEGDWQARVERISPAVDPETRTVGVVVAVPDPYRQAIPGTRPPLIRNMYVRAEILGPAWRDQLVVPRAAVQRRADGPVVYVADDDDRLRRRPVTLGPAQGDIVVIAAGLRPGERVVVSDPTPAIDGMLLAPTADEDLSRRLVAEAAPAELGGGSGKASP
ncbi:MAG: efflux RND transporter periplasmic adaptor subunit [Rhodospirillales bacterium]|nr:MAG: efflux RND transporter periplasmic adaptor subunit [Rhodospirillales bacterium]